MKYYRVTVTADKYPTDYTVEASSWRTAVGRAISMWQKRLKGSRATELRILAVKTQGVELLSDTDLT